MVIAALDVDECIETLKSGECVSERSLKLLCAYVSELLIEESNVQPVLSPVTVRFLLLRVQYFLINPHDCYFHHSRSLETCMDNSLTCCSFSMLVVGRQRRRTFSSETSSIEDIIASKH
jgi:hypothetical protein